MKETIAKIGPYQEPLEMEPPVKIRPGLYYLFVAGLGTVIFGIPIFLVIMFLWR